MTPADPQPIALLIRRPRLYLDEDMSERILDVLAGFGIDAISANRGFKGLWDPDQLLTAIGLERTLATSNTGDFLLLHRAWLAWSATWNLQTMPRHRGILLVHSAKGFDYIGIASVLKAFVDDHEVDEIEYRAFAWTHRDGWHEQR
jgi:hypothetical protein